VTLTVKEGAVEFTNSFGMVQATAMTESTARSGSAPTEPKRLQTLQVVQIAPGASWSLVTSALTLPDAAEKLVGGGGWVGFALREFATGTNAPASAGAPASNEVRVARVFQNSPAGRAGLQPGDVLLAFGGSPVTNASQIERTTLLRPDSATTLKLRRGEEEKLVTLGITNRSGILPGPSLSLAQTTQLANLTRELVQSSGSAPAPGAVRRALAPNQKASETSKATVSNEAASRTARVAREAGQFSFSSIFPFATPGAGVLPRTVPVADRRYAALARLPGGKSGQALRAAAENNLGVIFESEDALGPAIRAYGRAVYLDAQAPLYRFNLGLALRKIGSFERAEEELEKAARLAPTLTEPRKWLASTRSLLGQDAEALSQTEALLALAPRDHSLWELKAQLLTKLSRFPESLEAARKAVELDPDCPTAQSYVAGALHTQKQLAQAEAAYRKALELSPFEAALHSNLGLVQRDRGQLWPAEQSFRKAIELQPDFALAHLNLGNLLADGREFAQATAVLERAAELAPVDASAHKRLGNLSFKKRRFDEAEKHFRNALEISPNDPETHCGLGEIRRARGQFIEAERLFRKAIDLNPDYADAHTFLGIVQSARGQIAEAEKSYRKAMELAPNDASAYHNLAELYREVLRQPGKAEELYRKAIKLDPGSAGSYSGLGLLAARRGDLTEAERLLRKARGLDPDSSGINNNLGEVLRQRGRIDEAVPYYRKALELDPDNLGAYSNLGIIHAMRREFSEAEKVFRALIERTPASGKPTAYVNLANVFGEQGKLDEAEKLFRQALELRPGDPQIWNALAWFLADHQLKLDEALTLSRRSVQATPNNPGFLDTLGWALFQRGELDESEKIFKKALELVGENPPAAEIREHLKKVSEKKGAVKK
jgi:tetratricopeptide (TPR) repeat protein